MYEPLPAKEAIIWAWPESPTGRQLALGCHLGRRKLAPVAIEAAYGLFEAARGVARSDPKCARHVEVARMVLQHAMLENLPSDDPRLREEAEALVRLGAKVLADPDAVEVLYVSRVEEPL